jgi:hypothetical protein
MSSDDKYTCPHCGSRLSPWSSPDLTSWGGRVLYVCFDDTCPYYQEGWDWMLQQYNVKASYRHRYDPETGEIGPLAVWSQEALKDQVTTPATPADAATDRNAKGVDTKAGPDKEGSR